MTEKEIIELLLSRYLKNELDKEETKFIESWINDNETNKQELERMRLISDAQHLLVTDVDVQKAREKIKTEMLIKLLSKRRRSKTFTGILSLLIVFTSGLAIYLSSQPRLSLTRETAECFSVKTGKGESSECTLPDSTHIWLNSNTEVRYQKTENGKLRTVKIKGEAFFDVAKNKTVPFEVTSRNIKVKVFGTKFNFKELDSKIQVTLQEGSLGIYNPEQKELTRLTPGLQAEVDQAGKLLSVDEVDLNTIAAWKSGIFEFKDVRLGIIADHLVELYGVSVSFDNKSLKDERFRCVINRNKSLLQTLELLKQTSGIDYKIKGMSIIFK